MKILLFILALAFAVNAQEKLEWKLIPEMSGPIPDHPGLSIEMYAARIARGDKNTKVSVRIELPNGAPVDLFHKSGASVPLGFDVSSITRMTLRVSLNCETLVLKPVGGSAEIYQFNGKHFKSKEPPFKIDDGHGFA